jgi:hypothetical protein
MGQNRSSDSSLFRLGIASMKTIQLHPTSLLVCAAGGGFAFIKANLG